MNSPQTPEGELAWSVIDTCKRQVRHTGCGVAGLDYPAFLQVAEHMGADRNLLVEILPDIEACLMIHYNRRSNDPPSDRD